MPNSPTTSCCWQNRESMTGENRRGFFGQAAAVLCGGVALLVPAAAGVAAFLNPLRQKSQSGQFMRLASLDVLPEDGTPQKVPVIADRTDAWNRFPAEPIGAVFLRRMKDEVVALQVICPHAGCSIDFDRRGQVLLPLPHRQFRSRRQADRRKSRPAPATWTRWKWKFATRTRCG